MASDEDSCDDVRRALLKDRLDTTKNSVNLSSPGVEFPRSVLTRNLVAYWLLGLCNNYAYCIMLSAAHDILAEQTGPDPDPSNNTTPAALPLTIPSLGDSNGFLEERDCNPVSTGAILLANILPGLVIKMIAPFILSFTIVQVTLCIIFAIASFLMVAFSNASWLTYTGVACASLSSGLGEVTLLRYSTHYTSNVISTWSSGTGMSGVLGSFSYASITSAGVSPRDTLLIMISVPVLMFITFFFILIHPAKLEKIRLELRAQMMANPSVATETMQQQEFLDLQKKDECADDLSCSTTVSAKVAPVIPLKQKFLLIVPLLKYMIPLAAVYLAEYFINQGLVELIYFKNSSLSHDEQYRWYQVLYQVGVFISRSSVNVVKLNHLWILPILQFANVIIFFCEAYYLFMPSIWIIFTLILFEGLLGGAAYVNTFYKVTKETAEQYREFSMGATSFSDSLGTTIAGFISIPVHDALCRTPIP